jgi:hypothetical protein
MAIQRRGSFLYARAWRKAVIAATVLCAAAGATVAIVASRLLESSIAGGVIGAAVLLIVLGIWTWYRIAVWVFAREARQIVEIGSDGIREKRDGREQAFIPWAGVREIEVSSTFPAGANLRVKSDFSEIAFSNVDLVVDEAMTLRQMHALLAETGRMGELLGVIQQFAPQAKVSLKGLWRRLEKKLAGNQ